MGRVNEYDPGQPREAVHHPAHYNSGTIEVIDAIEDWELGFHLGNAVKYIARARRKERSLYAEDLKKAIWYLQRALGEHRDSDYQRLRRNSVNLDTEEE